MNVSARSLGLGIGLAWVVAIGAQAASPATSATAVDDRTIELICEWQGKADARTDAAVREKVLAVAEATWKEACALYGVDAAPREKPVELHLYDDVASYEATCDRLVGGKLKPNLAFAHHESCSAHVVMQPTIRGDARVQLAPTWQTLRLVVHETAHVTRMAKFPNFASHPGWFVDGNAEWLESRVLSSLRLLKSPEQSPYFASSVRDVQQLLRQSRLPGIEVLLHDRPDEFTFNERYSVRYLLFRFLQEGDHAKAFREFIGDVRRLGAGKEFDVRSAEALKTRFALTDWSDLDEGFRAWLEQLKPQWDEVLRTLETDGEDWAQTAFDNSNAICFRNEPGGTKPYALEGEVTVLADRKGSPQMNLLLGRQLLAGEDSRYVSIALVPSEGVTIFDFDSSRSPNEQWKNLGYFPLTSTAVGKPIAFRVECETRSGKTALAVAIDGKVVAKATVDRSLEGPWGLGAQAGSSGTWRGIRQLPLSKR